MYLIGSRLRHHIHVHAAYADFGRSGVGDYLELLQRIVIDVEGGETARKARPVHAQAVEAVHLLARNAAVHLHSGLLVALVAAHIEVAHHGSRSLGDSRPGIPPTGDVLEQAVVKSGWRRHTLHVHHWTFRRNFHDLLTAPHP